MALSRSIVDDLAAEYRETQPLADVEAEHLDMLPGMFADGEYGWRDAEWVVQWFYRRHLGAYPDADRRAAEAAYGENDFEAVRETIADVRAADDVESKLDLLTDLTGVGIPVASAFLQFVDPDAYLVMGPREWAGLREAGELADSYPASPTAGDYERYLAVCRAVAERCDCDLRAVYRALWRLGAPETHG